LLGVTNPLNQNEIENIDTKVVANEVIQEKERIQEKKRNLTFIHTFRKKLKLKLLQM